MQGARRPSAAPFRWWQLSFGVACMMLIANLQHGWTLFVQPIRRLAVPLEVYKAQLRFWRPHRC